ncbi:MAG: methyltransferase domain-containing protein, partial [Acidimicrobiales bacterium]
VGPAGSVRAVDADSGAVDAARMAASRAGVDNVTVEVGDATDTGIPPASADVVMIRHVLAHNGGREQAIVDHAATLVRPGGSVYLVDVDQSAIRTRPVDTDLADLTERYVEWHRRQGNDIAPGLRLGELLAGASLEAIAHYGRYQISAVPPHFRTPAWAGRDALLAAGMATAEDVARWDAAFDRVDGQQARPIVFVPLFFAFGRRPAS